MSESPCLCQEADDGTVSVCDQHVAAAQLNEWRVRCQLDTELDAAVRELAGRSPTRVERKPGATGSFAIARR